MKKRKDNNSIDQVPLKTILYQFRYRVPMRISEVMNFQTFEGESSYYVCPRCKVTMDREFTSFCSRCGQRLDWSDYENATVIDLGKR